MTGQNGLVRRLVLLAICLSVPLWTAAARSVAPDDINTMSDLGSCLLAGDAPGPSNADLQWGARHHTIAAVTESIWKSALVHAELGATPSARTVDTTLACSSPDPRVCSAPHYLRHTPLLI